MILWMILWTRGDVFSSSPLLAGAVPRSNHRLREVRQVLPALLSDAPPETPNLPCGVEKSEQRNTETPHAAGPKCLPGTTCTISSTLTGRRATFKALSGYYVSSSAYAIRFEPCKSSLNPEF